MEDDLYEILDVPPGATGREIRAAYGKLSPPSSSSPFIVPLVRQDGKWLVTGF